VILIGEMRDLETISIAITSAETGHLVLGTLHTPGAPRTVNRVVDVFPPEQVSQIRAMVSESLRGVVSQQLMPRTDGRGRVAALEILVCTSAIANLIRENRTFQIPSLMQIGIKQGMRLMDVSLAELVHKGVITADEAIQHVEDQVEFLKVLAKTAPAGSDGAAEPDDDEEEDDDDA
jgi:twitching motility protein PilT